MTLEEAIIHCKEKACGNTQCALEHRQLAEWLQELQSLRSYKNNSIEERARLAAWQIFEEIGLSQHSVERVVEIIAEKMNEQKSIDTDNACEWLIEHLDLSYEIESLCGCGVPVASDNVELCQKRLESIKEITDSLRKAMEKD